MTSKPSRALKRHMLQTESQDRQLMRVVYRHMDQNVTTIEHHWRQPGSIIPQLDVYEHNHDLRLVTAAGGTAVPSHAAAQLVRAEARSAAGGCPDAGA